MRARTCGHCKTDLSLFDIDADGRLDDAGVSAANGQSIDEILESIAEGKEVQPEIFESIKSVAQEAGNHEGGALTGSEGAANVKFECPVCGIGVDANAVLCPGCGAEFAEETAEQFACPVCNATVAADAKRCPECGVEFTEEVETPPPAPEAPPPRVAGRPSPETPRVTAPSVIAPEVMTPEAADLRHRLEAAETPSPRPSVAPFKDVRALYRELPKLVNEVKPMLLSARNLKIDIEDSKKLINDAIASGKKRDVERAVLLVNEAKQQLEDAFVAQISRRVRGVIEEMERVRSTGVDVAPIERLAGEAISLLERRDFEGTAGKIDAARTEFERRAGGYHRAKEALNEAQRIVDDAKAFAIDTRDAETLIDQGRDLVSRREWDRAKRIANDARTAVIQSLPDVLDREMKLARNTLLDLKMRGTDLTKPVGILKQASIHIQRREYGDAMRYVRMFRREMEGRGLH